VCIFSDFRIILGVPWGSLLAPFCDLSVILDAKMGDCFQVHIFGDPGMEMMPESGGCMCYNHSKTEVFEWFHVFHLFTKLVSRGMVLGTFLVTFGDLGGTFSDF